MKYFYLIAVAILIGGCHDETVNIEGTAKGLDGGVVSITNTSGQAYFAEVVKSGKFEMPARKLPAYGYFTLSISKNSYLRDFEIYLEPGKYTVEIPQDEFEYLKVKTGSKTQNDLSAYYNLESSLSHKTSENNAKLLEEMNAPESKNLTDTEFNALVDGFSQGRNRERGIRIAAMHMFIEKHPQSSIIPHIIAYSGYQSDPETYYMIYKKLSSDAKNTDDGKRVGEELEKLIAQRGKP